VLQNGLTEIGLLIERRNFERAQSVAQQLLLQFPNNAAVHAALGDVASARHLHREAMEWYELSLRLEQNQDVRERLSRQRDLLDEERLRDEEEIEGGRDNRPLLIAGVAAGLILLILAIGLISSAMRNRHRAPAETAAAPGRPITRTAQPTEGTGQQAPVTARPGIRPGAPGPYGVGAGSAEAPAGPNAPVGGLNVTQSVDAPLADRDVLLTRALGSLNWPNGDPLGWRVIALMDPFTGYALISVEVPPAMRSNNLYTPVISMAYRLAVTAVQSDRGIDSLTVRMLTQVEDERGRHLQLVAFRGNTTREALDYYLKRGIEPDAATIWSHVFATTWWNPVVPTGQSATSATPQPTS
jgi:hypothetical protein